MGEGPGEVAAVFEQSRTLQDTVKMAFESSGNRASRNASPPHAWAGAEAPRREAELHGPKAQPAPAGELPALFCVGPPRTATTWLHAVLRERLSLPRLKETYFFDKFHSRGLAWYLSHFERLDGRMRGEIAPSYFFSEDARQRIRAAAGRARIVVTLRDPVQRLYSLYKMRYSNGAFPWSFAEACERDGELRTTAHCAPHLAAWQRCFGRDHVLTLLYEDLPRDPQSWLDQVCGFAGIPHCRLRAEQLAPVHSSTPALIPSHPRWTRLGVGVGNWIHNREWEGAIALVRRLRLRRFFLERGQRFPQLDPKVEQALRRKLAADIEALESLLGRDLTMWKPRAGHPGET
jgi:hypothetical protein